MSQTTLKKKYEETIVPALTKEFSYTTGKNRYQPGPG